jgi:hypothetical protein
MTTQQQQRDNEPQPPPRSSAVFFRRPAPDHPAFAALTAARICPLFWGTEWKTNPDLRSLKDRLVAFFKFLVESGALGSFVNEYRFQSEAAMPDRFAELADPVIPGQFDTGEVRDEEIRDVLLVKLAEAGWEAHDRNSLYLIFLPPLVDVNRHGRVSCVDFCAYHDMIEQTDGDPIFYIAAPYPSCSPCFPKVDDVRIATALEAITTISTHEIQNALTDPVYGLGWFDDSHREIADPCVGRTKILTDERDPANPVSYVVRMSWSNADGMCR